MQNKITQYEFNEMMVSKSINQFDKSLLMNNLNRQNMTLTMKQILVLLRNSIKENDEKDVRLFHEILKRSIKDEPILQMNEEIKEALRLVEEFTTAKKN
jgi:hypothetical protein